jgi:hypothetical protein
MRRSSIGENTYDLLAKPRQDSIFGKILCNGYQKDKNKNAANFVPWEERRNPIQGTMELNRLHKKNDEKFSFNQFVLCS